MKRNQEELKKICFENKMRLFSWASKFMKKIYTLVNEASNVNAVRKTKRVKSFFPLKEKIYISIM